MNRNAKVLVIGWDAADWKVIHPLMDAGKMPNVQRLVENGAVGQIATLHPPLSPMLWTSIATGKRPFNHGIHGFSEPAPDGLGVQPVTNLSRKSKARVEHSQPEGNAQHRHRLVAQPSGRADQRRDGFRPLPPRRTAR